MEMGKFSVRIPLSQIQYMRARAKQKNMSLNYFTSQVLLMGAQREAGQPKKEREPEEEVLCIDHNESFCFACATNKIVTLRKFNPLKEKK